MSRSGIAGSYGNSSFSFLRNGRTVFHTGCSNSHSLQQFKRRGSSLFSTPSPAFATCIRFLMMAALPGVRRYLSVAVVCIFLIISSVEHLFMCLVAICMSSLEDCAVTLLLFWFPATPPPQLFKNVKTWAHGHKQTSDGPDLGGTTVCWPLISVLLKLRVVFKIFPPKGRIPT